MECSSFRQEHWSLFSSIGVRRSTGIAGPIGTASGGGLFGLRCTVRRIARQDFDHLPVRGLAEIGIEASDRPELVTLLETDHVISKLTHESERILGSDRHGENELAWSACPRGGERRTRRCAGRNAVINNNRHPAADV